MSETQHLGASDGVPNLAEYWKSLRVAVQIHGQSMRAESGQYEYKHVGDDVRLTDSTQVILTPGIPSEEQVGSPVVIPDGELVIQVAVVGFTALGEYQHLVRGITTPWIEILKGLEQDPDFLHKIHPRKLEELVADAYKEQGYKDVILTPYSGDKGQDVIVSATLPGIGTIKIVDQVKRYDPRRKVTANDVRALAGVVSLDQAVSKGIVTTTSDFAPGIQTEFATLMPSRIELKNGVALKQWLSEVYRSGTA